MMSRSLIPLVLLVAAGAMEVTPIDKVITLLTGMKTDLEAAGTAEAASYNKYACFCKTTTDTKSTSVKDGKDEIDRESADVADKTQTKKTDSTELSERKAKQEELAADLQKTTTRCAEEKATYNTEEADMAKALSSLKSAIKAMKDGGHTFLQKSTSLVQSTTRQDLLETLAMADAMNMISVPKRTAVTSMIQGTSSVDPSDPEYKYHSNDIVTLLEQLQTEFKAAKTTLDGEYDKSKKACDEMKASLNKEMGANTDAMKALERNIDKLSREIADHRENLVNAQSLMQDDELYLKDLTAQCEARANDFDQRSSMRGSEHAALTQALTILTGDVKTASDKVNKRALLLKVRSTIEAKPAPAKAAPAKPAAAAVKQAAVAKAPKEAEKTVKKHISFLQVGSSNDARKEHALALLASEGERLSSFVLTSLAQRSEADPFKKIKGLIQKLIERLITEANNEATKKGFCDTELGKARKDRDFRREETQDINTKLEGLEAKEDALTQEIKSLGESIVQETLALKSSTTDRKEEKDENIETLKTANEGLEAVREALLTLRSFYSQAAKAALIQASPVGEDTSGPGFSGNYKGNQSGSKAVLAILETIESDFDRTIRTTEAAEAMAARDFVEMMQACKMSIAKKTTKSELDTQDLTTTKTGIEEGMASLVTAQGLLDDALRELEDLKPACIDTGMSYSQRVAKREEEMTALKTALCILDPSKVETECQ